MVFDKIAQGPGEASEYHRLMAGEHKLWCFGLKGVHQPKYSFYHDTMLHGGEVYSVDPKTGIQERSTFNEIDKEENREDLLFSLKGKIYLLVYSHYDGLHFHDLFLHHPGKGFEKQHKLSVDAAAEAGGGRRFGLVSCVSADDDAVYLAYLIGTSLTILKLQPANHAIHVVASANVDGLRGHDTRLVNLAVHGQKAWAFYGETGCGFRWDSARPILIDLTHKTAKVIELPGNHETHPPFSFGGSKAQYLVHGPQGPRWLHVAGSRQIGEGSSEFVREVWYLDLGEGQQQAWHKAKVDLPADLHKYQSYSGISEDGKSLYVGDQQAIYAIATTNL